MAVADGIAEVSFWDATGMAEADRLALRDKLHNGGAGGNGANPLTVNDEVGQPWTGKLVAYWPLDINGAGPFDDKSANGHHMTQVGTLTAFADYPPVDAAAGGATGTGAIVLPGVEIAGQGEEIHAGSAALELGID